MKQFYESWKNFNSRENDSLLREISFQDMTKIGKYLDEVSPQDLSFNEIFGDKLRIAFPFETNIIEPDSDIGNLLQIITSAGYTYDLKSASVTRGKRTTRIGKFLNKLLFDVDKFIKNYKEYKELEDLQSPDMSHYHDYVNKQEKVRQNVRNSYDDVFIDDFIVPSRYESSYRKRILYLIDFWNKKSEYYVQNPDFQKDSGKMIIVSRSPIDVLRMSDFKNIESCHSPGNSYFKCAVQEARGHGLVAYVVDRQEYEDAKEKFDLQLQDYEIFADRNRSVPGIEPESRIRLRKYTYMLDGKRKEIAIPEVRTYGKSYSDQLYKAIKEWASSVQEISGNEQIIDKIKQQNMEDHGYGEYDYSILKFGGHYSDTGDGTLWNRFFDAEVFPSFAEFDFGRDEDSDFEELLQEANSLIDIANAENRDDINGFFSYTLRGEMLVPDFKFSYHFPFNRVNKDKFTIEDVKLFETAIERKLYEFSGFLMDVDISDVEHPRDINSQALEIFIAVGEQGFTSGEIIKFRNYMSIVKEKIVEKSVQIETIIENILTKNALLKDSEYSKFGDEVFNQTNYFQNLRVENVGDGFAIKTQQVEIDTSEISKILSDYYLNSERERVKGLRGNAETKRLRIKGLVADDINYYLMRGLRDEYRKDLEILIKQISEKTLGYEEDITLSDIIIPNSINITNTVTKSRTSDDKIIPDKYMIQARFIVKSYIDDEEMSVFKKFILWYDKNYYKVIKELQKSAYKILDKIPSIEAAVSELEQFFEVNNQINDAKQLVISEDEPFQDYVKKKHPTWKKNLIGKGGNKYKAAPFKINVSMKRAKSAPPGAGGV